MCGITGELGGSDRAKRALATLHHRGPDRAHFLRGDRWGVGAARLRIVGSHLGDQPLTSSSGNITLAFNGEVFNWEEAHTGIAGVSDVANLPNLLEVHGVDILPKLRGPFAMVAYDQRDHSLFMARDELGVRPLFVRLDKEGLLVASEPPALLEGAKRWSERGLAHLLAMQFWHPEQTPWEGIEALRPGTWRRYRIMDERVRMERGAFTYQSNQESAQQALASAFVLQARTERKTGITLSGGLDSSAVAGALTAVGHTPDVGVVGYFPDAPREFDERPHARAVARELGIPLREVPITSTNYLSAQEKLLKRLGAPCAGPGGPSQWILAEALASEGVGVVFSGQGGDELFGGYERTRLFQQWDQGLPLDPSPGYGPLASRIKGDPARDILFRGCSLMPHLRGSLRDQLLDAARSIPGPDRPLADVAARFEAQVFLPGLLLIEDLCVSAFGMEGRVPLLDPALAQHALGVPMAEKSPPQGTRQWFRGLMGDWLPTAASARTDKMGFPVPLHQFLPELTPPANAHPWWVLGQLGFGRGIGDAFFSPSISDREKWFLQALARCAGESLRTQEESIL